MFLLRSAAVLAAIASAAALIDEDQRTNSAVEEVEALDGELVKVEDHPRDLELRKRDHLLVLLR